MYIYVFMYKVPVKMGPPIEGVRGIRAPPQHRQYICRGWECPGIQADSEARESLIQYYINESASMRNQKHTQYIYIYIYIYIFM